MPVSHLSVPAPLTPGTNRPRMTTAPSQRLPPTALFQGPASRNASHSSLVAPDRSSPIEVQQQHLPRAGPPTASFSGSRPSLIGPTQTRQAKNKDDDFRADALWTEMQRTLADVELSAMNSSHVFSSSHARALEDLRTAQLGLAQAWAKSEADEMGDEEFGNESPETSAVGQMKQGVFGGTNTSPTSGKNRSRPGSSGSGTGANLEQETERDMNLARKRREANDRYFRQVNRGVLDVVSKLDEVANAMRRVEKESRDLWNDTSGSEELGEATETEHSPSQEGRDSDALTNSPIESKR